MKILYGVVGEGMGHAIRSAVILEQLVEWGHEIQIVVSGRAADYLASRFEGVNRIWGLTMVMADNELQKWRTARTVLGGAIAGWPENMRRYAELTRKEFGPEVVISDFETFSALYGQAHRLPIISIDNMQVIRRCRLPSEITAGRKTDFRLAKAIIKAKMPGAYHYLISTFFDVEPKKKRTTVVSPILRDIILEAEPHDGDHLLVYQTSESFSHLPGVLKGMDIPVRVYGLRRDVKEHETDGNLTWCPFSEEGFVEDLATCRGVIASAGFTLIGEALHLGKPYLATPVRGQFEQTLNARFIEHLGYGLCDEELDGDGIKAFLAQIDEYHDTIADNYPRKDNSELMSTLEGLLDQVAADL